MIPEQAVAIARQGVSALGFICVRSSPRYVTPLQIRAMSQALIAASLPETERVGVFVNATSAELEATITTGQLTAVQLHGQEMPAMCQQVRQTFPRLKVIKALRIRSEADLLAVQSYEASVDAILLDAYHPDLLGGTGKTLDWRSLQTFQPAIPWILAGGLTSENIETALTQLSPQGIDLSSGVELSPGNKCLTQVESLFATLKNMSTAQATG